MVEVTRSTANWRLFGGGGLILGGVLWIVAAILGLFHAGATAQGWLAAIGLLVVGAAHLFVAFGQTGSNGAVGNTVLGKVALVVAAAGWVVWAVAVLIGIFGGAAPKWLYWVIAVLVVVGGIVAAVVIFQKGVAKGIAKWAYFVPVVFAAFLIVTKYLFAVSLLSAAWVPLVLALLLALTGIAYLLNGFPSGKK